MISKENIERAQELIKPHIHHTPVLTCSTINKLAGGELFFKCENLQKIGAFKIRGAMNAVLSLPHETLSNGIATHSSGNHAQAIAYAARHVGTRAYIVMPSTSPKVKVEAVKGYGAEIIFCEPTLDAREAALKNITDETGAEFIHPFNDTRVISGQATCAKELIEEVPGIELITVPVGGGGLLSGTLLSAAYFSPETEVYAGEPEGAADAVLSLKNNRIESAPYIDTIADGLLTKLGDHTFPIIRDHVKEILLVSDKEIISAMKLVFERMKMVIEPNAAVPLAAVLKYPELFRNKKTGIIFSGGNVDIGRLSGWIG